MTLEQIQADLLLVDKGLAYVDSVEIDKADAFLPKLRGKIKEVCDNVRQFEQETGLKFDWNTREVKQSEQMTIW